MNCFGYDNGLVDRGFDVYRNRKDVSIQLTLHKKGKGKKNVI
jgi:hypothetical protein